jgi:hypothetical protein
MRRTLIIVPVGVVLAGLCWMAWGICKDKQLDSGFSKVRRGDSESEVVRLLGHPKRVERCGDFMGPLEKQNAESCAREYLYASSFSPLVPQYYIVRFDAQGRVSSTAPYSSP